MLLDDEVGPNSCQCLQLEGDNTGKELEDCVANNSESHAYGKKGVVHVISFGFKCVIYKFGDLNDTRRYVCGVKYVICKFNDRNNTQS